MDALDAFDGAHHHGAAPLEILLRQQPLAILLQAGRLPHAEDHLTDRPPHPLLRVPEGEEARLQPKGLALVVEAEPARDVVERELDVIQLRAEIRLVGPAHGFAAAGLVVDHLDLSVADVVDAVDLADDLCTV